VLEDTIATVNPVMRSIAAIFAGIAAFFAVGGIAFGAIYVALVYLNGHDFFILPLPSCSLARCAGRTCSGALTLLYGMMGIGAPFSLWSSPACHSSRWAHGWGLVNGNKSRSAHRDTRKSPHRRTIPSAKAHLFSGSARLSRLLFPLPEFRFGNHRRLSPNRIVYGWAVTRDASVEATHL
jgi:hypothetical protein